MARRLGMSGHAAQVLEWLEAPDREAMAKEITASSDELRRFNFRHWPAGSPGGIGGRFAPRGTGSSSGRDDGAPHVEPAAYYPPVSRQFPPAWKTQPNAEFRNGIANKETPGADAMSDYGYTQFNPKTSALGRYQITNKALVDLNLKNPDGSWRTDTPFYRAYHITSDQEFLHNPAAQEDVMSAYMARQEYLGREIIRKYVGMTYVGIKGETITVTLGGLVAAIHRQGPTKVREYFGSIKNGRSNPHMHYKDKTIETRLHLFQNVPYAPATWPPTIPNPATS